jgi:hypothetical protein
MGINPTFFHRNVAKMPRRSVFAAQLRIATN